MATQVQIGSEIQPAGGSSSPTSPKPKKKLIRRNDIDHSQLLRRGFQSAFLLLNVWIGAIFYLWVRQFEPGGAAISLQRPAGVEGWLPIAGLMNLRYSLADTSRSRAPSRRNVPAHRVSRHVVPVPQGVLQLAVSGRNHLRIPVAPGRKLFRRNFVLPRWLDLPLRGLKYLLLGFFVWAVASMAADGVAAFMRSPYGVIADVKMLNFFRHIGQAGAITLGRPRRGLHIRPELLVPLPVSLRSAARHHRARQPVAHPSQSGDLYRLREVRQSLPFGAAGRQTHHHQIGGVYWMPGMRCRLSGKRCAQPVVADPANTNKESKPAKLPAWAMAAGIAALFFGIVGFAKTANHWDSPVPRATYQQLVPNADEAAHPMPGEN